jgi:hypothetical protein
MHLKVCLPGKLRLACVGNASAKCISNLCVRDATKAMSVRIASKEESVMNAFTDELKMNKETTCQLRMHLQMINVTKVSIDIVERNAYI